MSKKKVVGKKIDITPPPSGVQDNGAEIIEVPIENELEERFYAKFRSIDGTLYRFKTHDDKGTPYPYREQMAVFLALAEVSKGGNPAPILKAFKVALTDSNNRTMFDWKK